MGELLASLGCASTICKKRITLEALQAFMQSISKLIEKLTEGEPSALREEQFIAMMLF